MKTRLNLTIEENVLARSKKYASELGTSISKLVENYLNDISLKREKESFIDFIDKLEVPQVKQNTDRKQYYEEKAKKYGF